MTDRIPPRVANAPGLIWKPRKTGWRACWQARTDLVKRGYLPKTVRLAELTGEPSEAQQAWMSDYCQRLQAEMLVWGRGGVPVVMSFDGTWRGLIACYQTDADSPYHKIRYRTRQNYDSLARRIERDRGIEDLRDTKARELRHWHQEWSAQGHVAMAHALIGMVRTLCSFGATILESEECERLCGLLHKMRFTMPGARTERLTAEQANLIRAAAHAKGLHSIALAQAFQFELMLRQKDVIGEWVPMSEPGMSTVHAGNEKWIRGLRWEEIDTNWILRHTTSKRQKDIEFNLRLAPMVVEEMQRPDVLKRNGPIIVSELHGIPWTSYEFRRQWRMLADACGIPKTVFNMDSRSGAISEATDAGADLEHVRHAATHSDIAMTQRYSRGGTEKIAGVMQKRVAHRNKSGT